MSGREWKPGDVALVTSWRGERLPAFYTQRGDESGWCVLQDGDTRGLSHEEVSKAEPAVVLTLPNGAKAGWPVLVHALQLAREATGLGVVFAGLIEQIEAQVWQPKPEEPTGLGAVVVDDNDCTWVRAGTRAAEGWMRDDPWRAADGPTVGDWKPYAAISAVCILSEGVAQP